MPFIFLAACNNPEPANISDLLIGDWNYYFVDVVEVVNESGITDSSVIQKEYSEISFRKNEMYSANILGCGSTKFYSLKHDTIFLYYDSTKNQQPYYAATIEHINNDALLFKNDTTEFVIHRIPEPAYTLTNEMQYRKKFTYLTNSDLDAYMSALKNNPENYYGWYSSRELLFGVEYGEIEKDKALKRINSILSSDNINKNLKSFNKRVKREIINLKKKIG